MKHRCEKIAVNGTLTVGGLLCAGFLVLLFSACLWLCWKTKVLLGVRGEEGIPFRQAHNLVGQAVHLAAETGKTLDRLTPEELQTISPAFQAKQEQVFDPAFGLERHNVIGGTASQAVLAQIELALSTLQQP